MHSIMLTISKGYGIFQSVKHSNTTSISVDTDPSAATWSAGPYEKAIYMATIPNVLKHDPMNPTQNVSHDIGSTQFLIWETLKEIIMLRRLAIADVEKVMVAGQNPCCY